MYTLIIKTKDSEERVDCYSIERAREKFETERAKHKWERRLCDTPNCFINLNEKREVLAMVIVEKGRKPFNKYVVKLFGGTKYLVETDAPYDILSVAIHEPYGKMKEMIESLGFEIEMKGI